MATQWHVGPELWAPYAAGSLDPAVAASVDAHVTGCAGCREAARGWVRQAETQQVWRAVRASVATPRPARPLRWLRRLGVPETDLVLLGAADAVMLPWITAIGAALACAIVSGFSGLRHETAFFALAPLVPLLAVVAAFDATESLREVSACTPYPKLRLALLRTTAALLVALPVTVAVGFGIPGMHDFAYSWVLPGLGLTSTALMLLTWLAPWPVAGLLSVLWASGVAVLDGLHRLDTVTTGAAQLAFAVAGGAVALVFVARTADVSVRDGRA